VNETDEELAKAINMQPAELLNNACCILINGELDEYFEFKLSGNALNLELLQINK